MSFIKKGTSLSDESDEATKRGRIRMFLRKSSVEYTVAMLIISNAAMFGVQADFAISSPEAQPPLKLPFFIQYINGAATMNTARYGLYMECIALDSFFIFAYR